MTDPLLPPVHPHRKIILALDIGSSSVRCTAYRMVVTKTSSKSQQQQQQQQDEKKSTFNNFATTTTTIESIPGCSSSSRSLQCVQPNTGYINLLPQQQQQQQQQENQQNQYHQHHHHSLLESGGDTTSDENSSVHSLLDEIDSCIDDQLKQLDIIMTSSSSSSSSSLSYQVVGIGISSFVMNLVGIDIKGELVGPTASCSYACNTSAVALECKTLRHTLGPTKLQRLHQQTGAPLHSAFAIPQLRVLYNNNKNNKNDDNNRTTANSSITERVHQWQTIASLCLTRWTGGGGSGYKSSSSWPISYSEASWTGLLNIQTCTWDSDALALLPIDCQRALPPLADCTDPTVIPGGIPEYCRVMSEDGDDETTTTKKKNPYWDRWPKLRGIQQQGTGDTNNDSYCRLFLGLGDGACANIGSHCCTPSRIAVTIGTSAAARIVLPLERQRGPIMVQCDNNKNDNNDNKGAESSPTPQEQPSSSSSDASPSPSLPMLPAGLFCYRIDQSHVLLGGALTDGGSMVEWCRSLLNLTSPESFSECMTTVETLLESDYALSAVAAANTKARTTTASTTTSIGVNSPTTTTTTHNSLTMIPFLSGERATGWRDGANGALLGITRETTPAHLVKACMEAVILRIQAIVQRIQEGRAEMTASTATTTTISDKDDDDDDTDTSPQQLLPPRIVASGTALERNKLWRQMLADCSGLQVCHLTEIEEATSRGAGRMVAIALAMEHEQQQQQDDSDADGNGNGIVARTTSSSRCFLQTEEEEEEELSSSNTTISEPRGLTQPYWKSATSAQENLISAISPLWI